MKFNLSQFKKISEDRKTAVLRHPSGHKITIAKNALSPEMKRDLSSLPMHYADGGDVPQDQSSAPPESIRAPDPSDAQSAPQMPSINIYNGAQPGQGDPQAAPQPGTEDIPISQRIGHAIGDEIGKQMQLQTWGARNVSIPAAKAMGNAVMPMGRGFMQGFSGDPVSVDSPQPDAQVPGSAPQIVPPDQPSPQAQGSQDPYGTQAYIDHYSKGVGEQKIGLQREADALQQQGDRQASALGNQISQQQLAQKSYQDHYNDLESERQKFQADLQSQKIDPRHFLNSQSTGQKISTSVGLILGGIGGAMLGQPNSALGILNHQIERDIDAQKTNLGKSKSLLDANMRQFGNLRDATDMTRVMSMDIVSNQLKQAAATAQGPIAKARALQAAGQLDQQSAPIMSQLAMRRSLLTSAQNGQLDPARAVQAIVPESQKKDAMKELSEAQQNQQLTDDYLQSFDHIASKFMNGAISRVDVNSAKQAFIGKIIKETEGRYNYEAAQNLVDSLFPKVFQGGETTQNQRMRGIQLLRSLSQTPVLDSFGIKVPQRGQYDQMGRARYQLQPPVMNRGQ